MNEHEISRRGILAGAATVAAATSVGAAFGAPASATGRAGSAMSAPARSGADLVVMNGRVLTMTRHQQAQAVAVRNGKIVAVGSNREIGRLAGRRTEVVDASGGTVLPGINDSHLHLSRFALTLPPLSYNVDTATIPELVAIVRTAVDASTDASAWIRGQGWNDNRLPAPPTRADLDPASGGHPVVLIDFSFHAVSANSRALQLAGITRDTVPPPGGVIEKDAQGEPTGVLRETAQGLVLGVVPPYTETQISGGIDTSIQLMHSLGITSITDPGIDLASLGLYKEKARAGRLDLRINAMLSGGRSTADLAAILDGFRPLHGIDHRNLQVRAVKFYADGIPTAAQTAWLHKPYLDGTNGSLVTVGDTAADRVEMLQKMIARASAAGFQVGTHATGDRTIDVVVRAYLDALRKAGAADRRHYVIHGDLTPRKTLRKMAKHGIGVNMNATIKYLLGRTLDPVLGPQRTDYQWPYRSAIDAGVTVSSSSDAPVTFPSWLQGVMAARLREGMFGGVAGVEERISVLEALATYTRNPAHQDGAESYKGTLEQGMAADLCIMDGDLLKTPPRELVELEVAGTVLAGKVVHDAKTPSARGRAAAANAVRSLSHDTSVSCLQQGLCCCSLVDKL